MFSKGEVCMSISVYLVLPALIKLHLPLSSKWSGVGVDGFAEYGMIFEEM